MRHLASDAPGTAVWRRGKTRTEDEDEKRDEPLLFPLPAEKEGSQEWDQR